MAALTITPADVNRVSGDQTNEVAGVAGLLQGRVVYRDLADQKRLKLATHTAAASSVVAGILLSAGSTGQPLWYQTTGEIDIGATVTVGEVYCLGEGGDIVPYADLGTGDYVVYLGTGKTATNILLSIHNTGIQKA